VESLALPHDGIRSAAGSASGRRFGRELPDRLSLLGTQRAWLETTDRPMVKGRRRAADTRVTEATGGVVSTRTGHGTRAAIGFMNQQSMEMSGD
jgi:hypothetical protein